MKIDIVRVFVVVAILFIMFMLAIISFKLDDIERKQSPEGLKQRIEQIAPVK